MKRPARTLLLRITIVWAGLGQAGARILASTAGADAASILALCCTGPAISAAHRAAQATGIISACSGLAAGLYLIWSGPTGGSVLQEGIWRAAAVLWIAAAAAAHTALTLRWHPRGQTGRIIVAGTVLCTGAAAELTANYALVPGFDPARGYLRALTAVLILDVLGTIVIMLMRRFGQPFPDATPPHTRPGTRTQPPRRRRTSQPAHRSPVRCLRTDRAMALSRQASPSGHHGDRIQSPLPGLPIV